MISALLVAAVSNWILFLSNFLAISAGPNTILTATTAPSSLGVKNQKDDRHYVSERFILNVSKEQTYTSDCQRRYLRNKTWGESVARFVDKINAKEVVREFNVPDLKIPQTIAFYDESNISSFTIEAFLNLNSGNGAVIKPTHASGGVAMIYNDTYHCFKACRRLKRELHRTKQPKHEKIQISINESEAYRIARTVIDLELSNPYLHAEIETQYHFIPRGILIEERLHVEEMMEYHWPVAMSIWHETTKKWNRMVQMVTVMSLKLPSGIIRIDLYASDHDVYFSEFTYTSNSCRDYFDPLVADAFLYGALYKIFTPNELTSAFIEAAINQRLVYFIIPYMRQAHVKSNKTHNALWEMTSITAHPNDTTACQRANSHVSINVTVQCLATVAALDRRSTVRCIGVAPHDVVVLGLTRRASFRAAMERVDWKFSGAVLMVLIILVAARCGTERKRNQMTTIMVYLAAVTLYKYVQPNTLGFFSSDSPWRIVADSYYAFVSVHPMTSPWVGWIHVASYWFQVAAWNSKTIQGVLVWYFLYECVTLFLDECMHLMEDDQPVKCLRVTFMHFAREFAVDEVIRQYVLPPFFVYLYLLPKLILQWTPFA